MKAATELQIDIQQAEQAYDPDSYQVLSFDQGDHTGWAIFQVHPEAMGPDPDIRVMDNVEWWSAGEFTGGGDLMRNADEMVELVNAWPNARLTIEDFKVRQAAVELSPAELKAIVTWAIRPRYFVVQSSALALSTVNDERLKAWGFWLPGKPHARDAISHALTFLKRKKDQEVRAARKAAVVAGRGTV